MNKRADNKLFPRYISVTILFTIALLFASNHVAARIAFENGTGVLLAVIFRSGAGVITLIPVIILLKESFYLPPKTRKWQFLLGLLIATQSALLYSAVALIPVAMALLLMNLFPIILTIIYWIFDKIVPSKKSVALMFLILCGLVLVLDIAKWLSLDTSVDKNLLIGSIFAILAACVFAFGLWISNKYIADVAGPVRSFYTIFIVFLTLALIGNIELVPGTMSMPTNEIGWLALIFLSILYAIGFSVLFVFIPRLDMVRNAPIMNTEPIASLVLAWFLLDQIFSSLQLLGGAIVMLCIVVIASTK